MATREPRASPRSHLHLELTVSALRFVVLDFDLPRRGLVQIDHTPLIELEATISQDEGAGRP